MLTCKKLTLLSFMTTYASFLPQDSTINLSWFHRKWANQFLRWILWQQIYLKEKSNKIPTSSHTVANSHRIVITSWSRKIFNTNFHWFQPNILRNQGSKESINRFHWLKDIHFLFFIWLSICLFLFLLWH